MLDAHTLQILTESAKYDVSCSSSGSKRANRAGGLGNASVGGICHSFTPDGRCISLLKILMSNECLYDCEYCPNRRSSGTERARITPDEVCRLTINFYALLFFIPMAIMLIFVVGVGLILSVLQVYFRDVEYIWDVFCTLLFYCIPIIYPLQQINTHWIEIIIKINPLYSMLELFRQCVLYCQPMSWKLLLYALAWAFGTLFIGILFFNKKSDDLIFHL